MSWSSRQASDRESALATESRREGVTLMETEFDPLTERDVIAHILTSLAAGQSGWMVNPNTDVLRQAGKRVELRRLIDGADLVIADGMPLLWASRVQCDPLPERVPVSSLIHSLTSSAAKAAVPVF